MSDDEKRHEEEIKVTDKRRFTAEGTVRPEGEAEHGPSPEACGEPPSEAWSPGAAGGEDALPPIDFPTFILSLATSAQVHLGVLPNPSTGKEERHLTLAKETIDLLGILREKTKGNLTPDEERLFDHILYDLRMIYVEQGKQKT
jgi:hypothetical protein